MATGSAADRRPWPAGTQRPGDDADALAVAARRSSFLGALPHDELEDLLSRVRVVQAERSRTVLRSNQDAVLFLLRGAAMATAPTPRGHRSVLAILEPGSTWGLETTLSHPHDAAEVTALSETAGLLLEGRDLRWLVNEHPSVARAALRVVTDELANIRADSVLLADASATERVVRRIVELCNRWGRVVDGRIEVTLRLSQDELASWARTSRESAAKALQELRRAGILRTGRLELVVLDPEGLQARADPATGRTAAMRELLRSAG